MAIKYKSARQEIMSAILAINFADMTTSGVAENAISVPSNAIVTGGGLTVITAWNNTGAATLSLGDAGVATRYANAVNLKATGHTALTVTGYKHTVEEWLKTLITVAAGDATVGDARIILNYVRDGRAAFSQGLDFRSASIRGA